MNMRIRNEKSGLTAARAIASVIGDEERNEQHIVPSIFNEQVVTMVRHAVIQFGQGRSKSAEADRHC
ncbi:hypothetical protein Elgi_68890 [Paenibacillus elgii]|nr:hypothetical protein Elgi_68890 [Paenibacillus elgii]